MNLKTPLIVLSFLAFGVHCRHSVLKEQSEVVSSCFEISLAYLDSIYTARGVQVDTIYFWASTNFKLNSEKYEDIDAKLMKSRIEKGKYSYNKDIVWPNDRFKPKVRYVIFKNINYCNAISTVELLYGSTGEAMLSVIVIDNNRDLVICKSDIQYRVY